MLGRVLGLFWQRGKPSKGKRWSAVDICVEPDYSKEVYFRCWCVSPCVVSFEEEDYAANFVLGEKKEDGIHVGGNLLTQCR